MENIIEKKEMGAFIVPQSRSVLMVTNISAECTTLLLLSTHATTRRTTRLIALLSTCIWPSMSLM